MTSLCGPEPSFFAIVLQLVILRILKSSSTQSSHLILGLPLTLVPIGQNHRRGWVGSQLHHVHIHLWRIHTFTSCTSLFSRYGYISFIITRIPRPTPLSKTKRLRRRNTVPQRSSKYQVFLGGSCNPTTWRKDIAIPTFKSLKISYYNPQVAEWGPQLIELENQAKQNAEVMFFVIDNQTRSVASMIEAAQVAGTQRKLMLVVHEFEKPGSVVMGEKITEKEFKDLQQGQRYLQDLVERQGIPVFDNIHHAVQCTATILKKNIKPQDLTIEDAAQPVKMAYIQIGDKLIKLREVFDDLDCDNRGVITLKDVCMAYKILTDKEMHMDSLKSIVNQHKHSCTNELNDEAFDNCLIDFNQFCCIMTEFRKQADSQFPNLSALKNKASDILCSVLTPLAKLVGKSFIFISCLLPRTKQFIFFCISKSHLIPKHSFSVNLFSSVLRNIKISLFSIFREFKDLQQGQRYLQDLVERQGIPVFDNIHHAVQCTATILKKNIKPQDLTIEDAAQPVKMAYIQIGDKLIKLREVFDDLDCDNRGVITLKDVCMAYKILTDKEMHMDSLKSIVNQHKHSCTDDLNDEAFDNCLIDFNQFCCIMTEFRKQADSQFPNLSALKNKASDILCSVLTPLAKLVDWVRPETRLDDKNSSHDIIYETTYRDIYLGGTRRSSTWREDIAIPLLKKQGLTYFIPQDGIWSERLIPMEITNMENSQVLLFVISKDSRSLADMIVAAHYVGLMCQVVLCIQYIEDGTEIDGEKLSEQAVKDYNRGRVYLSDLATRAGIPVFDSIEESVECAAKMCLQNSNS
ncbi:uncharacterized protein [Parasteatoda tepidariorum]|uniref:uncharacterized protein n=1 Tax=Parasteatoda tepidariorum TaxID=114398 RepID=UPI0039BCC8F7